MSAFPTIVGRLGELSESELRQLYLVVGVRLGFPDGASPAATAGGSASSSKGKKKGKPGAGKTGTKQKKKGNPSRKSQWATNPRYIEYSRLKKTVAAQAKEAKVSFNAVTTPEAESYRSALAAWLEEKSTFRDRSGHQEEDSDSGSESEAEQKPAAKAASAPGPPKGSSTSVAPAKPVATPLPPAPVAKPVPAGAVGKSDGTAANGSGSQQPAKRAKGKATASN